VADLAPLGQRNHFAQVVVVTPEGTVVCLLASDQRKERQIDLVPDQSH
jgi:hypothetical protein